MTQRVVMFDNKPYGMRAGASVIHENKILLIHRIRGKDEFYAFPGGGVEHGETVHAAIKREVKEETNQDIIVEQILYHLDYKDDSDQYYGLCRYKGGGELKLNGPEVAHQNAENRHTPCWVDLADIPGLALYPTTIKEWVLEDAPDFFKKQDIFRHWHGVFIRPGR